MIFCARFSPKEMTWDAPYCSFLLSPRHLTPTVYTMRLANAKDMSGFSLASPVPAALELLALDRDRVRDSVLERDRRFESFAVALPEPVAEAISTACRSGGARFGNPVDCFKGGGVGGDWEDGTTGGDGEGRIIRIADEKTGTPPPESVNVCYINPRSAGLHLS